MFFSAITKNANWEILTKNIVTFLKYKIELGLKNLHILVVYWKSQFLGRGWGFTENQFTDLMGWGHWQERGGSVLERGGGGLIP